MTLNFKEHNLKLYLYLATAAAAAAGLWYVNHLRAENAQYKAANESMAKIIIRQQLSESANFAVITKLNNQLKSNTNNYERVNHEINKYRDELNTCRLNSRWVQLHNTATKMPASESSTSVDGITAADALDTVNYNYQVCYQWQAVAEGWQDWYSQQQKIYENN